MALPLPESNKRFTIRPECATGYTRVTCLHPYHGEGFLYFSDEEFGTHFMMVTKTMWINGFNFLIQPME